MSRKQRRPIRKLAALIGGIVAAVGSGFLAFRKRRAQGSDVPDEPNDDSATDADDS
jgi:hypothetical protein